MPGHGAFIHKFPLTLLQLPVSAILYFKVTTLEPPVVVDVVFAKYKPVYGRAN